MRLLLDTHILLWTLSGSPRIAAIRSIILAPENEIFISVVSLWEIAIKANLGKLDADVNVVHQAIVDSGFAELSILGTQVAGLALLPKLHKDPFDRLLIAQAVTEPMKLITADAVLSGYSEMVIVL